MGYLQGYDDTNGEVLTAIRRERQRQEQLKASGRFALTCADAGMTDEQCLAVLVEEVGEVSHEIKKIIGVDLGRFNREQYRNRLREELVQVAAVAVGWIERLEAQGAK